MDVHPGYRFLHRPQNVSVIERRQPMWQSALDAHFSSAAFPCLDRLLSHLFEWDEIGVGFTRTSAERAKFAADEADICKVDIAIYDVGYDLPHQLPPQFVSRSDQTQEVIILGVGKQT